MSVAAFELGLRPQAPLPLRLVASYPELMGQLVGREAELDVVSAWLDAGPAALVVEGEAGIGKTTLLDAATAFAKERGYRVLFARPAAVEAQLSFAALADLLADVLEPALAGLPAPQRRALEVALHLADAVDESADRGAVAFAFLNALRALAVDTPVLVAVDDVQWLDEPSASALVYAARRVERDVRFLIAGRSGEDRVTSAVPRELVQPLQLGPLTLGALHHLLRLRTGRTYRRPLLRRLHEASGGNPFFALELAAALDRTGTAAATEPLPVPLDLEQLLRARVGELDADVREAVLTAAALRGPTLDVLTSAGCDEKTVRAAAGAGILVVEGRRVRFAHPLVASVVYADAGDTRRRELHAELARLVPDPEEAARHLALATEEPDERVAAILEEAAQRAVERGAPETGAELADRAAQLTPDPGDARNRRIRSAAESFWSAGDYDAGRTRLEQLTELSAPGAARAETLFLLAHNPRDVVESIELCERALAERPGHPLESMIHSYRAQLAYALGDPDGAAGHARAAATAAAEAGDAQRETIALGLVGLLDGVRGLGYDIDALARAADAELEVGDRLVVAGAPYWYLLALIWRDQFEDARRVAATMLERTIAAGDIDSQSHVLLQLATIELRAGAWKAAERYVDEGYELAHEFGLEQWESNALAIKGSVDMSFGRADEVRAAGGRGLEFAINARDTLGQLRHRVLLGVLELSLGDNEAAVDQLHAAHELVQKLGIRDPANVPVNVNLVEALVGAGRLEEAERFARELAEATERDPIPRSVAFAERSRGLIAAARGASDDAFAAFARSLEAHDALGVAFDRARTLLAQGRAYRRARRRRLARETLTEALSVFEQQGATAWAERAREELARIGGRAPSGGDLTPTEERIAALVAEGKTNKEVAAELFVSVHTIEATLTRIYGKLGVRSRTELAGKLALKL